MSIFVEHRELTGLMAGLLLLSILCKCMIGVFLKSLIKEAENMSATQNKLLKQCKIRFLNCYKLNDRVPNIPVFVDKFMNRISLWKFSLGGLSNFAGQLMLMAVFCAGVGACKGIIDGETLGEVLPFYLLSFLGLYIYFSVSSLVDLPGKKASLKTNLVDYLENHMAVRMDVIDEEAGADKLERKADKKALHTGRPEVRLEPVPMVDMEEDDDKAEEWKVAGTTQDAVFTRKQEKELEELLKEFLA